MKSAVIKTIIAGAVIFSIGMVILLVAGGLNGWDFNFDGSWETKVYECSKYMSVNDINYEFSAGSLNVEFYDGDVIKVEYPEKKTVTTEFGVTNSTLFIKTVQKRHFNFGWFNKAPETKVYIPQTMQLGLRLTVNAGTVTLGEGTFDSVYVRMNAGVISMENINCDSFDVEINAGTMNVTHLVSETFKAELNAGALNIRALQCDDVDLDLSAGSANIDIAGAKSDYTIRVSVSAGSCNLRSQNGGRKKLTVDVSAGSATINFDE